MLIKSQHLPQGPANGEPPGSERLKLDRDVAALLYRRHVRLRRSHACVYAVVRLTINGKRKDLKLHRLIARPGPGQEVHHINGDPLDNRRANLLVVDPTTHRQLHAGNSKK